MRKVKPAVGAWAVWETSVFPFLAMDRIEKMHGDAVEQIGIMCRPFDKLPKFFIGDKDAAELQREITRLNDKRKVSVEMMERRLNDERRRSVLGQLDPKEN